MRISRMRSGWALALAALVVAVPAALGGSASAGSVQAAAAENTSLWFVELDGTPASFRSKAKEAGIGYSERFAFTKLWNGVSIKVDGREINAVKQLPGVKAVYPVATVELDPIANDSPEMKTALAMTGADNAQSELGFSGQGIKVAVMDTGVDYDHADLGGDGVRARTARSSRPRGSRTATTSWATASTPLGPTRFRCPMRSQTTAAATARTSQGSWARTRRARTASRAWRPT